MNIQWDAEQYDKEFSFVPQYGGELISLIDKENVRTVLDLGCGSGILTDRLAQEGFDVCGMDVSEAQLELASEKYPHIIFFKGDAANFSLSCPVDAIFSNAVLHWIDRSEQPRALNHIADALKPGGQFVFEMGGYGNAEKIHNALRREFENRGLQYKISFFFPTKEEYSALLSEAGFKVTYIALFDRPTALNGENGMADWIRMFLKEPFSNISDDIADEIISAAVESLRSQLYSDGIWTADYVRLRGTAVKNAV